MPGDSFRNPDAFVQLMTEHQGRLFAYILSLLGDPDQANDVRQEANLVLWRSAGEFFSGNGMPTACRCRRLLTRVGRIANPSLLSWTDWQSVLRGFGNSIAAARGREAGGSRHRRSVAASKWH